LSQSTGNGTIDKAIKTYSQQYGVDANLIYSIMSNESNFKKDVVSKTGNKGLMQVSNALLKDSNVNDWQDPNLNTMVGTKYLSYLSKYFNGDMKKVIAAYNSGEGTVSKLVNKYGNNWTDHLPDETKKYLPKVIKLYNSLK
jgi:soluble lytic murein transglycosylase-like protein